MIKGKLYIVEGLWNAGKTTFIDSFIKANNDYRYIEEPNHLNESLLQTEVPDWYYNQFILREELALKYVSNGQNVIMERSLLFYYCYQKFFNREIKINRIKPYVDCLIVKLIGNDNMNMLANRKFLKYQHEDKILNINNLMLLEQSLVDYAEKIFNINKIVKL